VFRRHAANAHTTPLSLIQYLDMKTYLVGDINTKVDRASMAHALEVREPLMDHVLVEWLATLPSSMKLRGGQGKLIFKKRSSRICRATCCTGRRWASRCRS
jgi:asparagine synthase (glutamine-hydrolysing)